MNGKARKGTNRMERTAALLLSLAGLAEHAATRSAPVRFIVLWLLRQAEAVMADYVAENPHAAVWNCRPTPAQDHSGHTPADALALALSLRLLAFAVQAMAAEAGRLRDEVKILACLQRLARFAPGMKPAVLPPVERCDTS